MIPLWSGVSCDAARTACILGNFLGKKISFVGFFSIGPRYQLHFAKRTILTFVWNVWQRRALCGEQKWKKIWNNTKNVYYYVSCWEKLNNTSVQTKLPVNGIWIFLNKFYIEPLLFFVLYLLHRVSPVIRIAAPSMDR